MAESVPAIQVTPDWNQRQNLLHQAALACAVATFASLATTLWMYRGAHTASWIAELVTAGFGTGALAAKVENVVEKRRMKQLQKGVDRIAKKELGYVHFYNTYPVDLIPKLTEARKNILRKALLNSRLEIEPKDRELLALPAGEFDPEKYLAERQLYAGELSFTDYYRADKSAARKVDLLKVPGAADDVRANWTLKELKKETMIVNALGIDIDQVLRQDAEQLPVEEFKAKHGEEAAKLDLVVKILEEKAIEAIKRGGGDPIVDALTFNIDLEPIAAELFENQSLTEILNEWPDLFFATLTNPEEWTEAALEVTKELPIATVLYKFPRLFEHNILTANTQRQGGITFSGDFALELRGRNLDGIETLLEQYGTRPFEFELVTPYSRLIQGWVLTYFKTNPDQVYDESRTELTDNILKHACTPELLKAVKQIRVAAERARKVREDALVLAEHHYNGALHPDWSVVTHVETKEKGLLDQMRAEREPLEERLAVFRREAEHAYERLGRYVGDEDPLGLTSAAHFRGCKKKQRPKTHLAVFRQLMRKQLARLGPLPAGEAGRHAVEDVAAQIIFEAELELRKFDAHVKMQEELAEIEVDRVRGPINRAKDEAQSRKVIEESAAEATYNDKLDLLTAQILSWEPVKSPR